MKNLLTKFTGLGKKKKIDDEEAAIETTSSRSISTQDSDLSHTCVDT